MKIKCKPKPPPEQEESKLIDYFIPLIAMGIIYAMVWILGTLAQWIQRHW